MAAGGRVCGRLTELGYENLGEAGVPGRVYLRKRGHQAFNLAMTEHGGELWKDNLAIRDLPRRDPSLRARYVDAKRAALGAGNATLLAYSKHKGAFMAELVSRSRGSGRR